MIKIIDTDVFLLDPNNEACVIEYNLITQVWTPSDSLIDIHGVLFMGDRRGVPSRFKVLLVASAPTVMLELDSK